MAVHRAVKASRVIVQSSGIVSDLSSEYINGHKLEIVVALNTELIPVQLLNSKNTLLVLNQVLVHLILCFSKYSRFTVVNKNNLHFILGRLSRLEAIE
jgi:hypothetical protein